jgi:hypothetical protein
MHIKKIVERFFHKTPKARFKFTCSRCSWSKIEKLENCCTVGWDKMLDHATLLHKQKQPGNEEPCDGMIMVTWVRIYNENKILELEDDSVLGFCFDCFWAKLVVLKENVDISSVYKLLERDMRRSHKQSKGRRCNPSAMKLFINLHKE